MFDLLQVSGVNAPSFILPVGAWALLAIGFILGLSTVLAKSNKSARLLPLGALLLAPFFTVFAVDLPNTFVDGTVADADEVNENFAALNSGLEGYTISGSGTTSIPIPNDIVETYCGDLDGCSMIISGTGDGTPSVFRGRLIVERLRGDFAEVLQRNAVFAEQSVSSGGMIVRQGVDGDINQTAYLSTSASFTGCRVQDYAVNNNNAVTDKDIGLHFWPVFSSTTCNLTIRD
ncbi:MAG: hypothetical protein AAGI11_10740 [Pseudomonadota bacterium]